MFLEEQQQSPSSNHHTLSKIPFLARIARYAWSKPGRSVTFASVCDTWREATLHYSSESFANIFESKVHSDHSKWLFFNRVLARGQLETINGVLEGFALLPYRVAAAVVKRPTGQYGETPACVIAARQDLGAAGIELMRKHTPRLLRTDEARWFSNVASADYRGYSYLDHAVMAGNVEAVRVIIGWMREQQNKDGGEQTRDGPAVDPTWQSARHAEEPLPLDVFVYRGLLCAPSGRAMLVRWSCSKSTAPPGPTNQMWAAKHPCATLLLACNISIAHRRRVSGDMVVEIVKLLLLAHEEEKVRLDLLCGNSGSGMRCGRGSYTTMLHHAFERRNLPLIKFILESLGDYEQQKKQQQQNKKGGEISSQPPLHWKALNVRDTSGDYPLFKLFPKICFRTLAGACAAAPLFQHIPERFFQSGECAHAASATVPILQYLRNSFPSLLTLDQFGHPAHLNGIKNTILHEAAKCAVASLDYVLAHQGKTAASSAAAAAVGVQHNNDDDDDDGSGRRPTVKAASAFVDTLFKVIPFICETLLLLPPEYEIVAGAVVASTNASIKKLSVAEILSRLRSRSGGTLLTIGASFRSRHSSRANDQYLRRLITMIDNDSKSTREQKLQLLQQEAVMWSWLRQNTPSACRTTSYLSHMRSAHYVTKFHPVRFTPLELSIFCCKQGAGPRPVFNRLVQWAQSLDPDPEAMLKTMLRVWREELEFVRQVPVARSCGFSSNGLHFALKYTRDSIATRFFVETVFPMAVALSKKCRQSSPAASLSIADICDDEKHGPLFSMVLSWIHGSSSSRDSSTVVWQKMELLVRACGGNEDEVQRLCGPSAEEGVTPLMLLCGSGSHLWREDGIVLPVNKLVALVGREKALNYTVRLEQLENNDFSCHLVNRLRQQGLTRASALDLARANFADRPENYQPMPNSIVGQALDGDVTIYSPPKDAEQLFFEAPEKWGSGEMVS